MLWYHEFRPLGLGCNGGSTFCQSFSAQKLDQKENCAEKWTNIVWLIKPKIVAHFPRTCTTNHKHKSAYDSTYYDNIFIVIWETQFFIDALHLYFLLQIKSVKYVAYVASKVRSYSWDTMKLSGHFHMWTWEFHGCPYLL